MEIREENVKKYITSLLTASPLAMTMIQLSKDYRNTIGEPIPYQKLGYNSLEHFLKSIPNTVRVRGSGAMAEILPVLSEKSYHVMEMVSSQKKPPIRRGTGYCGSRTIVIAPTVNNKTAVQPSTTNKPQKIFYPKPRTPQQTTTTPPPSQPSPITAEPVSYKTSHTTPKSSPSLHNHLNKENGNYSSASSKGRINNILLPSPTGSPVVEAEARRSWRSYKRNGHQLERVEPPPVESAEDRVPGFVKNNLRKLIGMYPEGIWCAKIPEVYRQMFRSDLKYQDLGFNNLIDLCVALESIFHYVRPSSDDFKLYDRSKPLPNCAEQTFTMASYSENKSTEVGMNSALPVIDWTDMLSFLPPGTFTPGKEIPRAFVPPTTVDNECVDVVVGEIYDLSKFWVYKNPDELNNLMDEMQLFYNQHHLQYFMTKQLIREGVYCVQVIFGEYHRALIVDLTPLKEDMIRVIFIDYGTMAKVPIKDLCFLHEQFSHLPAQAIRCRLANICPPEKGAPWSRESSKEFRKLIRKRNLTAKISRINWKDKYMEICLADTTDENNVFYINDRLVELGYAVPSDKAQQDSIVDSISKPLVNFIHLFPTFAELEHGLAPSTSEMEVLFDCHIPINFCYPQYFFVDPTGETDVINRAVAFHEDHCLKGVREFSPHVGRCIDRSKMEEQQLDFAYFGPLEEVIRQFHESTQGGVKDEQQAVAECSSENLAMISERIEVLRSKTVDELRKDCILSEDIMNEILSICQIKAETLEERELEVCEAETLDVRDLEVCKAELRVPDVSSDVTAEALVVESIEANLHPLNSSTNPIVETEVVECVPHPVYSSTNPFLRELIGCLAEPASKSLPTLNRNNPFLTYLAKPEEEESSESCSSNGSTVYCAEERKWSTEDQVSEVMSVSSLSVTDSPRTVDLAQVAPPPPTPYCSPYAVPYVYPDWAGLGNPYYRLNFGYAPQSMYQPRYGFAQAPRPPTAVCPPPPGFGAFAPPPGQYNYVARTSVANVRVRAGGDFYGMYNERLRMSARDHAAQ